MVVCDLNLVVIGDYLNNLQVDVFGYVEFCFVIVKVVIKVDYVGGVQGVQVLIQMFQCVMIFIGWQQCVVVMGYLFGFIKVQIRNIQCVVVW